MIDDCLLIYNVELKDGLYVLTVRNTDKEVLLGDWFGCAQIVDIEAYGKKSPELQMLGCGMTGKITMDRMPSLILQRNTPERVKQLEELKNGKR